MVKHSVYVSERHEFSSLRRWFNADTETRRLRAHDKKLRCKRRTPKCP